jgi:hypothetical protein
MKFGENPVTLSGDASFAEVLDETFDRLWEWKVRYSIRRIQDMDERLTDLERELDGLVIHHGKDGAR